MLSYSKPHSSPGKQKEKWFFNRGEEEVAGSRAAVTRVLPVVLLKPSWVCELLPQDLPIPVQVEVFVIHFDWVKASEALLVPNSRRHSQDCVCANPFSPCFWQLSMAHLNSSKRFFPDLPASKSWPVPFPGTLLHTRLLSLVTLTAICKYKVPPLHLSVTPLGNELCL